MILEGRCSDFQDKYSAEDIEALEKKHTRQLLKERDHWYYVSELCSDCWCSDDECLACDANKKYNKEQILQILKNHVRYW